MSKGSKIPSEKDFQRASAALQKRSRGLSEISDIVLRKFRYRGVHECFVFDTSETSFKVYVFFRWDNQLKKSENSRLPDELKEFVLSKLEQFGRGKPENLHVTLELDSHEKVEKHYEGDYFLRLR